jgi:hypothetical protein
LRKHILAALVLVPCAAGAQTLLVEYQGTVSAVDRGTDAAPPPYAVGDSIGGTLRIDASFAPRDELAADPTLGRYGGTGLDFILGPNRPVELGLGNADLLLVYDDWSSGGAGPQDGMLIHDRSIGIDGEFNLVLGMVRPTLLGQLFSSDGLRQSFAVERETGVDLWGYIEEGFGEFWRGVHFALDRFSVKPGVCRM